MKEWVHDTVKNLDGQIVALLFHQVDKLNSHPQECLIHDEDTLLDEKLYIEVSKHFKTLQDAKTHAWQYSKLFSKGLD